MELFKIIKKPVITEKSQRYELSWVYTMEVSNMATKVDIRSAFEKLYWVKVESVNIVKTREKFHQTKTWIHIKRRPTVKALIKLEGWKKIADLMKIKTKD